MFGREQPGFDVYVGNPPFAGNNTLVQCYPEGILDWFKQLHAESGGQCDLVAQFFRRCFDLLRPDGSMGLIATNTIAQGDTRTSGLRWICLNGGTIYAARKRYKWPGVAAVVVSVVHLLKGGYGGTRLLDKRPVKQITAFLFANGGHEDPKPLRANSGKCFIGTYVLGMGFTFDDSGESDNETAGMPSPIATMKALIDGDRRNAEIVHPFLGYAEVAASPSHAHHRYIINFGERSEEECSRKWPDLMAIVEKKVKPDRLKKKDQSSREKWWIFHRTRPEMYAAIERSRMVLLAGAQASAHFAFGCVTPGQTVFSSNLTVIVTDGWSEFAIVQSRIHELWSRSFMTTMKDDLVYTPTTCFDNFPLPKSIETWRDLSLENSLPEKLGNLYCQFRDKLMIRNNEGLTSTYNRFHDPAETSSGLHELRRLHGEMDQAVLQAYGWSDVPTACGFGLDYLDTEDDAQLPDELQERIDSGELFFWDAADALDFQGQLQAYGAITGRRKLPWRYRWPDAVRDDVLARLLALNAERYGEEVALGLHSKSSKKASGPAAPGAKRRGRPPKSAQAGETGSVHAEQIGLGL